MPSIGLLILSIVFRLKVEGNQKTIRPYMKYLSKQIDENCEIFKNIQGDRGEIAYENCRLDELIHYKKI